jgi:hypothetical protein
VQRHPGGAGLEGFDAREHAHPFGDVHGGPEQVDGVAAGLAQRRGAFDDRDVEAVAGEPIGEHRARDAGSRDEDPHEYLPDLTVGKL